MRRQRVTSCFGNYCKAKFGFGIRELDTGGGQTTLTTGSRYNDESFCFPVQSEVCGRVGYRGPVERLVQVAVTELEFKTGLWTRDVRSV
jgi:hypothetical protein